MSYLYNFLFFYHDISRSSKSHVTVVKLSDDVEETVTPEEQLMASSSCEGMRMGELQSNLGFHNVTYELLATIYSL